MPHQPMYVSFARSGPSPRTIPEFVQTLAKPFSSSLCTGQETAQSFSDELVVFDPKSNAVKSLAPLLEGRGDGTLVMLPGGRLMLVGGRSMIMSQPMVSPPYLPIQHGIPLAAVKKCGAHSATGGGKWYEHGCRQNPRCSSV